MSYILEALKKAESERQVGGVPNLHAQNGANVADGSSRIGMWIIALLLVLVVLAAVLLWRSFSASTVQPPQVASVVSSRAPEVAPMSTPAPILTPTPEPASASAPTPTTTTTLGPEPAVTPSPPVAPPTLASRVVASVSTKVAVDPVPKKGSVEPIKLVESANVNASGNLANSDAIDEQLPFMAQLPEAIVREVPQVQVKGYIYSKTPSERTLIVGNNLFHEGDEVVPGVHLEKLLPKAAVLSYRGFRYRVGY